MEAQDCLVAVNSLADSLAILGPQPPQHQIGPVILRKISKSVDPTMLPYPVAGLYVVRMRILSISRSFGLLRGEEAGLRFRKLVKPPGALFTLPRHSTILQLF